eukprot:5891160-Amphidinium_carterae.1
MAEAKSFILAKCEGDARLKHNWPSFEGKGHVARTKTIIFIIIAVEVGVLLASRMRTTRASGPSAHRVRAKRDLGEYVGEVILDMLSLHAGTGNGLAQLSARDVRANWASRAGLSTGNGGAIADGQGWVSVPKGRKQRRKAARAAKLAAGTSDARRWSCSRDCR